MKPLFFSLLLLLAPFLGLAQENERLLPLGADPARAIKSKPNAQKGGDSSLELPFIDDFSADHFPDNTEGRTVYWTARQAYHNYDFAVNPPTLGVATLDGLDAAGRAYNFATGVIGNPNDTLESRDINLNAKTAADNIGLSFFWQAQGLGDQPEPQGNDSLALWFYAPDLEQWFWAWSTLGSSVEDFEYVYIPLTDSRYFWDGFKFRFINYGSSAGALDQYHLDYVWLDENNANAQDFNNDVAFVERIPSLLSPYTSMPWSHARETGVSAFMRPTVTALLGNLNNGPRTLEGNRMDVYLDGALVNGYPNVNSPGIAAQSTLDYTHSVGQAPNSFVFPTTSADTFATFDVWFTHNVSDFSGTESNDSMLVRQVFDDYYAYDDGTAEAAYELVQTSSRLSVAFEVNVLDSVFGIDFYWVPATNNVAGELFFAQIREGNNDAPGAVIAEASATLEYISEGPNSFQTVQFEEPVVLQPGRYFFGYSQNSQPSLSIGFDRNTTSAGNVYFQSNSQPWQQSAIANSGSVMLRPRFYTDRLLNTSNRQPVPFQIAPNPAKDQVRLEFSAPTAVANVFSSQGLLVYRRQVSSGQTLNVGHLPAGMYLVQLQLSDGRQGTHRLMISHP